MINWIKVQNINELKENIQSNLDKTILIFKHSTRCSISSTALARLERSWQESETQNILPIYVDLIQFREISSYIAEEYKITHESPQILLLVNNTCIYSESHNGIRYDEILEQVKI
jgi:bacillithiol system protein YtxJ